MALPHYEMGQWAIKVLLRQINDGEGPVEHQRLPCPLVRRDSVAAAPRFVNPGG
jgi:LacI family transcriptional regulator